MRAFNRKLRFKLQSVRLQCCAHSPFYPAFFPRTQIASFGAETPRLVMASVESLVAVSTVNPKVMAHCAGVRTSVSRISTGCRRLKRKCSPTVLAFLRNADSLPLLRLIRVVTSYRTELWRPLATPNGQAGASASPARRVLSLWVSASKGNVARKTSDLFDVFHVGLSNRRAVDASVQVGNLSLRWRVLRNRGRVLFSQGVNLIDRFLFWSEPFRVFAHLSGSLILPRESA
jgi:hypothetical protein